MEEQLLKDFLETAKNDNYDWNVVMAKFPELAGVDLQLLKDYAETAKQNNYDYSVVNPKFPELFGDKGTQSSNAPVKKKDSTGSSSEDGSLDSRNLPDKGVSPIPSLDELQVDDDMRDTQPFKGVEAVSENGIFEQVPELDRSKPIILPDEKVKEVTSQFVGAPAIEATETNEVTVEQPPEVDRTTPIKLSEEETPDSKLTKQQYNDMRASGEIPSYSTYEEVKARKEAIAAKQKEESVKRAKAREDLLNNKEYLDDLSKLSTETISREEEDVVPEMNKRYGKYGFFFVEAGFGDKMEAVAANGERTVIYLDEGDKNFQAINYKKLDKFIQDNAVSPSSGITAPQEELTPADREARAYFDSKGLDYEAFRSTYDKYQENIDKLDFIDGAPDTIDLLDEGEKVKYADYYVDGKIRDDINKVRAEIKSAVDGQGRFIGSEDFVNVHNDFDIYMQKQFAIKSAEAITVNKDMKVVQDAIVAQTKDIFGMTLQELANYKPKTQAEFDLRKELLTGYNEAAASRQMAADKYADAKTYFNTKFDKSVTGEYVENWGAFTNAFRTGYNNGQANQEILYMALGITDVSDDESLESAAAKIVQNLEEGQTGKTSRVVGNFHKARGFREAWQIFKENPLELSSSFVAESLSQMLPYGTKIVSGSMLTGAATGAAYGAVGANPVTVAGGALTGAGYGARTGMAATMAAMEYTNAVLDAARNQGYDVMNPQSLKEALENKDVWDEGRDIGLKRGITIGVIDYITSGLAGRVFKVGSVASKTRRVATQFGERIVFDPLAEGFGEGAAQIVSGQGLDGKEIAAEMMGGFGNNAPMMAVNTMRDLKGQTNAKIASDLTDIDFMSKEVSSDEHISTWANNMEKQGKIDPKQNQKIQKNIGLKRDARNLLNIAEDKSNRMMSTKDKKVQARVMQLLSAKEELSSTANRREVFGEKISEIKKEIASIATDKKLLDAGKETDLKGIFPDQKSDTDLRGKESKYKIKGKEYSKQEFLSRVSDMSKKTLAKAKIEVINDNDVKGIVGKRIFGDMLAADTKADIQKNFDALSQQEQQEFIDRADGDVNSAVDMFADEQAKLKEIFGDTQQDAAPVSREKLTEIADKATKAMSKVSEGTKIVIHETNEEYLANTTQGDGRGEFAPSKDGGVIHINASKADASTIPHEVFHAVFLNKLKTNDAAKKMAEQMMVSVRKALPENSELGKTIDDFAARYTGKDAQFQNEERLAELTGILASMKDGYKQLDKPAKTAIKQFFEKIAEIFGIDLSPDFGKTDESVIDLMNTLIRKTATGEAITAQDVELLDNDSEQGGGGEVGTISAPKQQKTKGVSTPNAKNDARPWVRDLVESVDIADLEGQNFVTNMYDYTNAGKTELGNGYSLELLGGRNYVPIIMERTGKKLGDVSNLAAFNSKAQAESFVRNSTRGEANIFAPHSGTLNGSWQFQQHIFEQLASLVLDEKILSNAQLISVFNSSIQSKKGIKAMAAFNKSNDSNFKTLNSFKSNPKELISLLDIENNYSPDLRKVLNQSIASNKALQEAIGVKNLKQFHDKMTDPLNEGVDVGDIMTFIKFDPSTFEITKTEADAVDHHPSFGWAVKAKIEKIMQPTEFLKSYDLTDTYKKYNIDGEIISRKSDSGYIKSNVKSSAGSIPKVATVAPRKQKLASATTNGETITTDTEHTLFKGMLSKMKNGKRFSVHNIKKGKFAALDKKLANDYKGDKPLKQFTMPAGTTVQVVKLDTKGGAYAFRRKEEQAIDASDTQVVKLITLDARGKSEQYIIKDRDILRSAKDVVETKRPISKEDAIASQPMSKRRRAIIERAKAKEAAQTPSVRRQKVAVMPEIKPEINEQYGIRFGGIAHVPVDVMMDFLDVRGKRRDTYKSKESRGRIKKIKESFLKNGFEDRQGGIYLDVDAFGNAWIAEGNHRVIAAKELGMESVPVKVKFDAARSNPNKKQFDESYAANPRSIISKEKIDDIRKKVSPNYHIGYISIWETNLVEPLVRRQKVAKEAAQTPSVRRQIIGENAELSQNVRDNLSVARQMEGAKESIKDIRLATGWERGVDGKWRYEIEDLSDAQLSKIEKWLSDNLIGHNKKSFFESLEEIKGDESQKGLYRGTLKRKFFPTSFEWLVGNYIYHKLKPTLQETSKTVTLGDLSIAFPNILNKYPFLNDVTIISEEGKRGATLAEDRQTITMGVDAQAMFETATHLTHEVQHIIQEEEGFASGGNPKNRTPAARRVFNEIRGIAKKEGMTISEMHRQADGESILNISPEMGVSEKYKNLKGNKKIVTYLEDSRYKGDFKNPREVAKAIRLFKQSEVFLGLEGYNKLAGEAEARNAQKRMAMTPEQRRKTTLQETEDVAREDQILFLPSADNAKGAMEVIAKGRQQKDMVGTIAKAREEGISDAAIKDYLTRVLKYPAKEVEKAMTVQVDLLTELPESFKNIDGGAEAGIKLFNRVKAYEQKLVAANKRRAKNKMSKQDIADKVIEYLEEQPEYKAEAETYTVGSKKKGTQKTKQRKHFSAQQAAMIVEFQKEVGTRPSKGLSKKLKELRDSITNRKRGARSLQEAKSKVKMLLRKGLPTSLYTKSEVIDIIRKIDAATEANTKDLDGEIGSSIENILTEVSQLIVSKNISILDKKIGNILTGKFTKRELGRLKGKKISIKAKERIDKIKAEMLGPKATAEEINAANAKLIARFNAIAAKENMTETDAQEMSDIKTMINLNSLALMEDTNAFKIATLDGILSDLNSIVDEGRTEFQEEIAAAKKKYDDNASIAYEEVTGEKIDFSDPDAKPTLDAKNFERNNDAQRKKMQGNIKKFFATAAEKVKMIFVSHEALDGLMDLVSKMPGELFGGRLQEIVTARIDESTRNYKKRIMEQEAVIKGKLQELYGKKWAKIVRKHNSAKETGIMVNGKELILSQNQMYYLYNQYKDPANHKAFESMGMYGVESIKKTDSKEEIEAKNAKNKANAAKVMEEMEAKLDPKVKEFADWQVDEYLPSLYEHYNEVYKRIYRTNLPWNEFYAGRIYREGIEMEALDLLADNTVHNTMAGAASTKARVNSSAAIKAMNGTDILSSYVKDMEHFAAYAESVRDIDRMFSNKYVQNAISNIYGKDVYGLIKDKIKTISNRGGVATKTDKFVDAANTAFIRSRIALSPVIMVKQLISFITYANDIGPINWVKYAAKNMAELRGVLKEVKENSVYMQDRKRESMFRVIESYSNDSMESIVPKPAQEFFNNFMMWFVKQGDAGAIYMGGLPNYSYYKAEAIKAGKTEQEAIDIAIRKFERDTKRTQQSQDLQDKDIFQTGDALKRAMNMFLTTPKQYMRKEIQSIRNLYRKIAAWDKNAGKGTIGENLRTFVMYHVINPMLFQYISMGLPGLLRPMRDDDDEDLMRAAILGNLNGLFILGELFSGIGDLATKKPYAMSDTRSVGILQITFRIGELYKRWDKTKDPVKKEAALNKLFLESLTLTSAPAPTIDRMFKNYSKVAEGDGDVGENILRLLNYSEYQIMGSSSKKTKSGGVPKPPSPPKPPTPR